MLIICLSLIIVLPALATEVIPPLAIANAALGGGDLNEYTPGVTDGVGTHNVGLLVKCWGKVTFVASDNSFFYINDGSLRTDGTDYIGIRVATTDLAPGNTITPPAPGKYVAITGISSVTKLANERVIPTLRPRRSDDIKEIM
jgi:hypothetical protein